MTDKVILLTIDALRADHVGCFGYERKTTPRLDAFAAQNRKYQTCIAQSSHTRESMPSMFFSAYPFELGDVGPVPTDRPTIATTLSEAGISTAGFHSNPYLSRAYRFGRGFEKFDDSLPLGSNRVTTFVHRVLNYLQTRPYTRAEELTDDGIKWMERTDSKRQFLWLHYMDPHGPYQPPKRYQRHYRDNPVGPRRAKRLWRKTVNEPESITDEERRALIDLYDAEIRYLDAEIGRLFDRLEARGMLSDALVVVGADHGDAFGSHGIYGHPRQLFEELIHVPLIVSPPNGSTGTEVSTPIQNIDIAPTILEAFDVQVPEEFRGTSLALGGERPYSGSPAHPEVAFAEASGEGDCSNEKRYAVRTDDFKLHVNVDSRNDDRTTKLFNLANNPVETEEVSNSHPDQTDRLLDLLDEHIRSFDSRAEDERGGVDSVVSDRLEELGYR